MRWRVDVTASGHAASVEAMFASLLGGQPHATLVGTVVRIQGVGFYDCNHGQRGRSANCIELHPIISITR
jgi:hypothetical protein